MGQLQRTFGSCQGVDGITPCWRTAGGTRKGFHVWIASDIRPARACPGGANAWTQHITERLWIRHRTPVLARFRFSNISPIDAPIMPVGSCKGPANDSPTPVNGEGGRNGVLTVILA